MARLSAIGVTVILMVLVTLMRLRYSAVTSLLA
jgi:hypothetical protein